MFQALKVQLWTDQVSWYLNLNLLLIMYGYLLKKNIENSSQVDWIIASIKKKFCLSNAKSSQYPLKCS